MKEALRVLRDRETGTAAFRAAAGEVCARLVHKMRGKLAERGVKPRDIVIVLILRSALAFLDAVTDAFPGTPIGIVGLRRDEETRAPHWYYENLPTLGAQTVPLIFDPMLATGGSAEAAVLRLKERGAAPKNIFFAGIVAAPVGFLRLAATIPEENIVVATLDEGLDTNGMIVPGIGDFGDRYFGYARQARAESTDSQRGLALGG